VAAKGWQKTAHRSATVPRFAGRLCLTVVLATFVATTFLMPLLATALFLACVCRIFFANRLVLPPVVFLAVCCLQERCHTETNG
jgi:hypothetical protein